MREWARGSGWSPSVASARTRGRERWNGRSDVRPGGRGGSWANPGGVGRSRAAEYRVRSRRLGAPGGRAANCAPEADFAAGPPGGRRVVLRRSPQGPTSQHGPGRRGTPCCEVGGARPRSAGVGRVRQQPCATPSDPAQDPRSPSAGHPCRADAHGCHAGWLTTTAHTSSRSTGPLPSKGWRCVSTGNAASRAKIWEALSSGPPDRTTAMASRLPTGHRPWYRPS